MRRDGHRFNWYHRFWHDWPEVSVTVVEIAKAHARYLGYEVLSVLGEGVVGYTPCIPPPGNLADVGPVVRVRLVVPGKRWRHNEPIPETLFVDVERRSGKFHVKKAILARVECAQSNAVHPRPQRPRE
jgi:hypothetical protein